MFERNREFKIAGSYSRISNPRNEAIHTHSVSGSQVVACLQILVYYCGRGAKVQGIFGQVIFLSVTSPLCFMN